MEGKKINQEKIDPKWLEGLTFRGATEKIVEKNGRKMRQGIPFEVPLKKENVLGCTDYGDYVIIAGNDGRKHPPVTKGKAGPTLAKRTEKNSDQ